MSPRDQRAIEEFLRGGGPGPAPAPAPAPPPGRHPRDGAGPQLAGPPDWPTLRGLVNRTAADLARVVELLFHDDDIWRDWHRARPGLVKILDGKILALAGELDELRRVPSFPGRRDPREIPF